MNQVVGDLGYYRAADTINSTTSKTINSKLGNKRPKQITPNCTKSSRSYIDIEIGKSFTYRSIYI